MSFANLVNGHKLPVLFIGSGLSRRYVDSPDWEKLLQELYAYMGKSNEDYKMLKLKLKNTSENRSISEGKLNALVASEIESIFNEYYFESDLVAKHPEWIREDASPFKMCIATILNKLSILEDKVEEIDLLKGLKGKVISIVTTNYDTLLEEIFDAQQDSVFIGQYQLFNTMSVGVNEIYKIHGCITQPGLITITERDYAQFRSNAKLFSAKLLTLISENPVVFIGYSIEDPNIQQTLIDLVSCLTKSQIEGLQNHFYLVDYKNGVKELQEQTYIFKAKSYEGLEVTFPISVISTDNYAELYKQLSNLTPAMNIQAVKQVKRLVREIVVESTDTMKNDDPVITIMMDDLSQLENLGKDQKMAIALGPIDTISEFGYGVKPQIDIFEDVLLDNKNLDSIRLLKETYERHYLKINQNLPIYKYVERVNEEQIQECIKVLNYIEKKSSVAEYLNKSLLNDIKRIPSGEVISAMPAEYSRTFRRKYLWIYKNIKNLELEDIRGFLLEELKKYEEFDGGQRSNFNRLISIYDLLKYKK